MRKKILKNPRKKWKRKKACPQLLRLLLPNQSPSELVTLSLLLVWLLSLIVLDSDRNATLILAEAALSFYCSAAEITVNRSSIRRQRRGCRTKFAASIKKDFAVKVPFRL